MGEIQNQSFQLSFNASLKVDFQGSRVTSDGGLILVRELDERLGCGALIEQHLPDSRGKNSPLPLADLLRQSTYSCLAGYEDLDDARRRNAWLSYERWRMGCKNTVANEPVECILLRSGSSTAFTPLPHVISTGSNKAG